jgi:hypothetical protein
MMVRVRPRSHTSNLFFLLFLEAWWRSGKCGEGEGAVDGAPSVFGKSGSWQILVREECKCMSVVASYVVVKLVQIEWSW